MERFERTSFTHDIYADCDVFRNVLGSVGFDVLILDKQAPGNALVIATTVRTMSRNGIVLLTDSENRDERILALSLGIDHVLAKPVDLDELMAVVKNLARFAESQGVGARRAADEGDLWTLDLDGHRLIAPAGQEIALSDAERALLKLLFLNPRVPQPREALHASFRRRSTLDHSRSLDVLISKLRRKVETEADRSLPLRAERGAGYVFVGAVKVTGSAGD